jgi:tetratricopeptide (TPR) repeat protein
MPPHGSAKKKKKGRDGTGKKKSRGAHHDHGRASSGVGGGSSLENLIDSGNEHLAMDRVEEGLNDLRKACALVPDSADAWDAYGMALAEFGAPDDAIKVLKRAAQLSPNIGYEKVSFFLISVWAIVLTCFFYIRSSCTSGNCWTTAKLPRRARAKAWRSSNTSQRTATRTRTIACAARAAH